MGYGSLRRPFLSVYFFSCLFFFRVYFFSISSLSPPCDDELRLGPRCSGQASSRLPAAVGLPPALPPSSIKAINFIFPNTKLIQVLAASQEKKEIYFYAVVNKLSGSVACHYPVIR